MGDTDNVSKKAFSRSGFKFETGFRIELLETGIWYTCKILQVDWENELILIHYDRWSHKFDEWVPMSSPDIRPCKDKSRQRQDSKKHFRVREDVFALWSDGRRYPGSIQAVLPNDTYQVVFFDGFMKKLKSSKLSKWTRENEQRFGTAEYAAGPSGALRTLPAGPAASAGTVGPVGFVPAVLDTKRKRKTNPIVEELLGPKRARRQLREENESRHRSPSGAPSTGSAASTPGGSGRKQSWARSSHEDGDADSAETESESEFSALGDGEEDEENGNGGDEYEDDEDNAEDDSVYSESAFSMDDTASSSHRSSSPTGPTPAPAAPSPSPGPAPAAAPAGTPSAGAGDSAATQGLPAGWRRVFTPRAQTGRSDVTLLSPGGRRFRSRAELERFVQRTGADLDPAAMFRRPAGDPAAATAPSAGRQPATRRASSASSPPPPAGTRPVGRPSFACSAGSLSQPATSDVGGGGGGGSSGRGAGRPSFTSSPSYPGTGPTLGRGVYIGPAGQQKKLPLGWTLEPIVDKPARPEQQDFTCVDRDCSKKFRKESLLQMHIKHYHPELRHLVNARSASVVRQAESRTRQHDLTPTDESIGEPSGRLAGRLKAAGESTSTPGGGRERRRGSSGERAWAVESAPAPSPPPPPPSAPPGPAQAGAGLIIPPTDDPKLLAEPVVSVRSDMRQLATLHSQSSADAKPSSGSGAGGLRGFRRPRRRQLTAEDQPGLSELIQIVDPESSSQPKSGRRPVGRPPRRHSDHPGADISERGDGARLLQSVSLEEAGPPDSPAPSSASVRDTDAAPDDDLASESGAGDKLEQHEVIHCPCAVQEEDGLMIQCELCLSWQHGVCLGIVSDTEVPSRYVCATCRHPWRVRQSQRYVWEQQRFRDGTFFRLPFSSGDESAMERAEAVMRAACDLTANTLSLQSVIHSLRIKLAIASDLNHPKLYLWARPWSPPPDPEGGQPEPTAGDHSSPVPAAGDPSQPAAAPASGQSGLANAAGSQPEPGTASGGQSEPMAGAAGDQSASLLAAALDSPALLAAVNTAAALMPADIGNHEVPVADNSAGHVAGVPGGSENGLLPPPAPAAAEVADTEETNPLASLSSDQAALLSASLAAAAGGVVQPALDGAAAEVSTLEDGAVLPPAAEGGVAQPSAAEDGAVLPPAAEDGVAQPSAAEDGAVQQPLGQDGTEAKASHSKGAAVQPSAAEDGVAQPSAAEDGVAQPSAAEDSVAQPSAAEDGVAQPSAAEDGVAPSAAAAAAGAAAEEPPASMEESDDPLSGVLDAIVGLLPSQSDLEQLIDGAVPEPTPAPPAAPVSEARIDPATCQVNLLQHVTQMQLALMARLDTIEQHVTALEKVAELQPDWDGGDHRHLCRSVLHAVLGDIRLLERMGRLS